MILNQGVLVFVALHGNGNKKEKDRIKEIKLT